MNKVEAIEQIAKDTNISKTDVDHVISCFFKTVKTVLKNKETLRLVGFGTFSASERKARVGRNPQTGAKIQIPSCYYPKFKPGKDFKDHINN